MKNLKIVFLGLIAVFMTTSCLEENAGIEYQVINSDALNATAGETITLQLRFTDDDGLDQISATSTDLNVDFLENLSSNPPSVTRDFEINIPSEPVDDVTYEMDLDISDSKGNRLEEILIIQVSE